MIFGKSYHQRNLERQARLKKEMEYQRVFAWLPVKLDDGRTVWLEWLYKRHHHYCDYHNKLHIYESNDVEYTKIPK